MRAEIRKFKTVRFLLLLPENSDEVYALDIMRGGKKQDNIKLDAVLTSDDYFKPYIRVRL